MKLDKLYKMQEKLDNHILENRVKRTGKEIDKEQLLEETVLALLVELGELANATRCFKHWSTKGPESKERILEELSDVWHFYLSIGNQIGRNAREEISISPEEYEYLVGGNTEAEIIFLAIYNRISELGITEPIQSHLYAIAGKDIYVLGRFLGFTDEEVEEAYLKKHKKNYKRQEEGY